MKRAAAVILAGALVLFAPGLASASISISSSPGNVTSWTLASTGSNTTSGGTITVSATQAYTLSVASDRAKLTEWITANSAYASSPKTLTAALHELTAKQSGNGVPIADVAVGTTAATIATGVGTVLTPATDTFALTLSQVTAITDSALTSGHTYHVGLTYTVSATL